MSFGPDMNWTGSGLQQILLNLDRIQAVKHIKIQDPGRIWFELMAKNRCNIVAKRLHFSNILDFVWTWAPHLKNILDCGWTWTEFLKTGLDLDCKI